VSVRVRARVRVRVLTVGPLLCSVKAMYFYSIPVCIHLATITTMLHLRHIIIFFFIMIHASSSI
jgi:hypothetical protein